MLNGEYYNEFMAQGFWMGFLENQEVKQFIEDDDTHRRGEIFISDNRKREIS